MLIYSGPFRMPSRFFFKVLAPPSPYTHRSVSLNRPYTHRDLFLYIPPPLHTKTCFFIPPSPTHSLYRLSQLCMIYFDSFCDVLSNMKETMNFRFDIFTEECTLMSLRSLSLS